MIGNFRNIDSALKKFILCEFVIEPVWLSVSLIELQCPIHAFLQMAPYNWLVRLSIYYALFLSIKW